MVLDMVTIHFGFDSMLVVPMVEKVDLRTQTAVVAAPVVAGSSSVVGLGYTDIVEIAAAGPLGFVVRTATVEHYFVVDIAPAAAAWFAAGEQTMTDELVFVRRTNFRTVDPLAVDSHTEVDEQGFVECSAVAVVVSVDID